MCYYDAKILKHIFACILCVSVCMCIWVYMYIYVFVCVCVRLYAHEYDCSHVYRWEKNLWELVFSFQYVEFDDQRPSGFVS